MDRKREIGNKYLPRIVFIMTRLNQRVLFWPDHPTPIFFVKRLVTSHSGENHDEGVHFDSHDQRVLLFLFGEQKQPFVSNMCNDWLRKQRLC
jgi:hypothetical protein